MSRLVQSLHFYMREGEEKYKKKKERQKGGRGGKQ